MGNGRKKPSSFGSECHSSSPSFAVAGDQIHKISREYECVGDWVVLAVFVFFRSELKMEAFGTRELQPGIRESHGESFEFIINKMRATWSITILALLMQCMYCRIKSAIR